MSEEATFIMPHVQLADAIRDLAEKNDSTALEKSLHNQRYITSKIGDYEVGPFVYEKDDDGNYNAVLVYRGPDGSLRAIMAPALIQADPGSLPDLIGWPE